MASTEQHGHRERLAHFAYGSPGAVRMPRQSSDRCGGSVRSPGGLRLMRLPKYLQRRSKISFMLLLLSMQWLDYLPATRQNGPATCSRACPARWPQAVSKHRDDVGAHLGIGDEIAVSEKVGAAADLDDVDRVQIADQFDLVGREHRRVDAPEPCDAAEQPARRRERLVVARHVQGELEPGDGGMTVSGSGSPPKGRSGSEKTLKILVTATSPSRSGATSTTLPMRNSRAGELFRA